MATVVATRRRSISAPFWDYRGRPVVALSSPILDRDGGDQHDAHARSRLRQHAVRAGQDVDRLLGIDHGDDDDISLPRQFGRAGHHWRHAVQRIRRVRANVIDRRQLAAARQTDGHPRPDLPQSNYACVSHPQHPFRRLFALEADDVAGVRLALEAGADRILLDNMDEAAIRESVGLCRGRAITEASGGMAAAIKAAEEMIERTNTAGAPWVVIEAHDKEYAVLKVFEVLAAAWESALKRSG